MKVIYADNGATTRLSDKALAAMAPYFQQVFGNPSSLHSAGQKAAEALVTARESVAKSLNADPKEITFTSGGSEADNQAIRTAAALGKRKCKTHIISTSIEHHAVLHTLKKLEKEGFSVTLLPVEPETGLVTAEQVRAAITDETCLVSVMLANNEIGTIEPVKEIAAVCREKGVLVHTDAVQAVGHIPVDVKDLGVDFLALSGHKFHGPKGVGALYTRRGIPLQSLIEGGAQERNKRAGTENLPAIVGMAAALEECLSSLDETAKAVSAVRDRLIAGLRTIPHCVLNGHETLRLPGNVNFCFEGIEGESLLLLLDDRGVEASSGSACTSGSLDPSHVLLAIGRPHEIAHGSLRLTIDETVTADDADYIVSQVAEVVTYLRGISPVWRDLVKGKTKFITE
ncbi:MAG: aminotransferase class V-fold PLP-dependent enzyme [Clostridia bacterium]|nr:aminotransferase class V-fold PLP-dependent enzyme [Clostridia bacterium]